MRQRADLTFKYNQQQGRHGWLRLTPAYSIKAVQKFLNYTNPEPRVLDPFSGTGTTGLLCSELGIDSALVEINPFLVWFTKVKTRNYTAQDLAIATETLDIVLHQVQTDSIENPWLPPIRFIDRWWSSDRLHILAQLFEHIRALENEYSQTSLDLLKVGFCRLVIQWSNAAFNHQSLSFKEPAQQLLLAFDERDEILNSFEVITKQIINTASLQLARETQITQGDARNIEHLVTGPFTQVITSPPYPNRMSYIRELRPYMYWLGFLSTAREAGELDWAAMGGTWGIATSRLSSWQAGDSNIAFPGFYEMLNDIATSPNSHSTTLANYVHRYFLDTLQHLTGLRKVMQPGGEIIYIVGNSKFYDVLVPVEQIYARLMECCGFSDTRIEILRKRNSKKELYEYVVLARA